MIITPTGRCMDSRTMSNSDRSLCEKSMKVVANMIRSFSFSIALKTVGTTSGKTYRGLSSTSGSEYYADMIPDKKQMVLDHQVYESKWSKEAKIRANPTFVTNPILSDGSTSHHVQELRVPPKKKQEESIDELAAKYIEKIRKQLGYGSQKS